MKFFPERVYQFKKTSSLMLQSVQHFLIFGCYNFHINPIQTAAHQNYDESIQSTFRTLHVASTAVAVERNFLYI